MSHSHGYQRAQIPGGATTSRLNPHISMYKKQPRLARTANGGDATFPVTAAPHASHISGPGAVRIAMRRRVSTAPVTERLHTSLANSSHAPPRSTPVRTNRTACEKLSQLKEVNSASVERTTLELQLYGAVVYASLAPAQPPPPAGLASGYAC